MFLVTSFKQIDILIYVLTFPFGIYIVIWLLVDVIKTLLLLAPGTVCYFFLPAYFVSKNKADASLYD